MVRRSALAIALSMGFAGAAFGQATTGSIFGQVPVESGETVLVESAGTGFTREVAVDNNGRYSVGSLPLGSYKVTLKKNGVAVDSRNGVNLRVGAGTDVSFAAANTSVDAKNLEGLTVNAAALPPIDVTSVDSRTVITAQQLALLPLGRSAEAIALLAPGAIAGSSQFTGPTGASLVSFGGSSVTENAYYINGFNTTDPLSGFGGITLPYGSIDQQEILTGGYGAAYGRSDGGVISQVGKRGTNEWHFGAQLLWRPTFLQGDPGNTYYVNGPAGSKLPGTIYQRNIGNKSVTSVASAYVGGPLIKDQLFLFLSAEAERRQGNSVSPVTTSQKTQYTYENPKWYAKLDWNINDNNILEVTGASNKRSYDGNIYDYDYDTGKRGDFLSKDYNQETKTGADMYVGKFTSYITDSLTLTAMYGKMKGTYYTANDGVDPVNPYIGGADQQNPAITGGNPIRNSQTVQQFLNPGHRSTSTNMRVDLSYVLGDHTLTAGIDNVTLRNIDAGEQTSGPGFAWIYSQGDADAPISDGFPSVDAPGNYPNGEDGYYVSQYKYNNAASVRTVQRAQYIEDSWQVSDRWLVKLGLRNDQFTNYNSQGQAYLRLKKPQWAPRLGFSWDVNGDSTMKVYGNAGRYYLALPTSVALRSAGASLYTNEYFTYSGIDANGEPTGLTPIASSTGGPVSSNAEYGIQRDARTAAASNLKSEYQDEYLLGFTQQINPSWVYGAKATVRKLRNAIDDYADSTMIYDKAVAMGIDPATFADVGTPNNLYGSYLFNPGRASDFLIANTSGGYYKVSLSKEEMGMPKLKRNYYGLELFLEHPFDGKWWGKIDYVYSKSYGNSEGQVRTDLGQSDVSATVDWDYAQVMQYAGGLLSNDRKHQIKFYGSYQIAPEWLVGANLALISGAPKTCLGYYGPDQTNPGLGYGPYYHWCGGKVSRPGDAGRQPWQHLLSVNVEYRPEWADKKLAFNALIYNLLNEQTVLRTDPLYGSSRAVLTRYDRVQQRSAPRYVQLGITYDY